MSPLVRRSSRSEAFLASGLITAEWDSYTD